MLLRRVSQHLKDQNWFAVGLDFLIVIAGVFIGIQFSNWNTLQQDKARAANYAERLETDLRAELDYAESLISYYASVLQAGRVAYEGLTEPGSLSDEEVLINAYRASQFHFYERRRSTYDEIVNSGTLSLIADADLRETATRIYSTQVFDVVLEESQNSLYRQLFRMTVDPDLQARLGRNCGDRVVAETDSAASLLSLNYACGLGRDAEGVSAAVADLREDEEVIRALRLRNVQVAGRLATMDLTISTLGLRDLFAEDSP